MPCSCGSGNQSTEDNGFSIGGTDSRLGCDRIDAGGPDDRSVLRDKNRNTFGFGTEL